MEAEAQTRRMDRRILIRKKVRMRMNVRMRMKKARTRSSNLLLPRKPKES